MKLIDIGANLANNQFDDDLAEVIDRANKSMVSKIYTTSTDAKTFKKNLDICNKYETIYTTWGLHPHNASHLDTFISNVGEGFKYNKVSAIGEFGLDYFRMISSAEEQIKAMNYFLVKAKETKLPLFMHERQAHDEFCGVYSEHKLINNGVVHCFTGNKTQAKKYLDMGLYLGITGWISDNRRNQELIEALKYVPNDKLMIETDSPYLKPRNAKQKSIRNEPSNLKYILMSIADIKHIPFEQLSNIVYNNTINFFGSENDK